uniref:C-type lectin domain-containing protein n=1 Tax=Oryzias latipes TaxID=8090 RepID=A0A3P9L140_ORYLA
MILISLFSLKRRALSVHLCARGRGCCSDSTRRARTHTIQGSAQKPGCPARWIGFGSSCYFFSEESKSWAETREFCRANEADLVVINTTDEKVLVFLVYVFQEGTWKWVDGSPLTLFWGMNQPDSDGGSKLQGEEDCAEIRETPGFWNDVSCERSLRWICEKELNLKVI